MWVIGWQELLLLGAAVTLIALAPVAGWIHRDAERTGRNAAGWTAAWLAGFLVFGVGSWAVLAWYVRLRPRALAAALEHGDA
ncbi:MAG TPA: hypothetical protein VFI22_08230 [Thermomicrobiales bacterium]|nr:hypothetical protein [Thermomicrobiales bacterium]